MQIMTPYMPSMTARHRRILMLYTSLSESFTSSDTILISYVFLAAHIELVYLETLVHGCCMFFQVWLPFSIEVFAGSKPSRT